MSQSIALVTLVVHDYDEAIAFFVNALRFTLVEDHPQGGQTLGDGGTARQHWLLDAAR